MSIIIGIDHGYYAIKTAHCSFPAGLTSYGEHEPYTRQGLFEQHPICPTVFGLTNGVLLYVGKTKDVQRRMRPIS